MWELSWGLCSLGLYLVKVVPYYMGMKSMITCLVLGAVMGLAHCAGAADLSPAEPAVGGLPAGARSICWFAGEAAYDAAVVEGSALPDGAWSAAVGACAVAVGDDTMVEAYEHMSLNEVIAVDGEAWLPVCQFEGGCK